jgi:hypothetical protein
MGDINMKKIIIALSMIPALAAAITTDQIEDAQKANIEVLKNKGLPTPDEGVKLVPQSSFNVNKWQAKQYLEERNEMKKQGYINRNSDGAYELLNLPEIIEKRKIQQAKYFKGTNSHLRTTPDDIPFAYTFVNIPQDFIEEFYGIAPIGTYVETEPKGWTGAIEFFKTSFSYCTFSENNMKASHGAAHIAKEEATFDVNGKITLINIDGNQSTGFLYHVNWFDDIFNRNVECASKEFSKEILNNTIDLAKKIDSR